MAELEYAHGLGPCGFMPCGFDSHLAHMEVIKIKPNNPKPVIKKIVNLLQQGGTIIYPTDTVYGLGANALDAQAVKKVFKIKKRSFSKPVSILVRSVEMASKAAIIDKKTRKILEKIWPGPITVILNKKKNLPEILTAGTKKIGLRIPDYKFILNLMSYLEFPITTTSANISNNPPSGNINEIVEQFRLLKRENGDKNYPELILDAGKLPKCSPSTVLDLSGSKPKVLRAGPISKASLFKIINSI